MALTDGVDALKAILSCVKADGRQVSDVILEEKNEAKLKKLTISNLTPDTIVLDTDEGTKKNKPFVCMSPLFVDDGVYDQNRACDAVFFKKSHDGYEVCYVELKSDVPSGFEGQFKSTRCFMRYLSVLSNDLCGQPIKIIRERFVIFHTDSKNGAVQGKKKRTKFSPLNANSPSKPDKFIVKNGATVRYTEFF